MADFETTDLVFDLTSHEQLRLSHIVEAIGGNWDPMVALVDETTAQDTLYSNLDEDQTKTLRMLIDVGELPTSYGRYLPEGE